MNPTDHITPGDVADWSAFLTNHQPRTTDVECPHCDTGRCNCLDTRVQVCAHDNEDWPCHAARAFHAGRIAGIRHAATTMENVALAQSTAYGTLVANELAGVFTRRADQINHNLTTAHHNAGNPT